MTSLVHLFTAATIFVHATMGCCAHEVHEASQTSGGTSSCCDCEHADQGADQRYGSERHDLADLQQELPQPVSQGCDHTDCKWPAPEVRDSDTSPCSAGIFPWVLSSSQASSLFVLGSGLDFTKLLPDASWHTMPVRAHLANCVLLL